jgi:hypothetical protein
MPQERPNHYGHLIKDAPAEPIKTVHLPDGKVAARRARENVVARMFLFLVFFCPAFALVTGWDAFFFVGTSFSLLCFCVVCFIAVRRADRDNLT